MARRRKPHKPVDPAEHAATLLARKRDIDELRSRGAVVTHDEQGRIINARRLDVFALLHERKGKDGRSGLTDTQLIAVRRLEALIATAYGHERPEMTMDRVSSSSSGAPGQNISQTMIDAMSELRAIMGAVGPVSARLLNALLAPTGAPAILTRWRQTVEDVTREARSEVQAAMIRAACENLALAWQGLDYGVRNKREAAA